MPFSPHRSSRGFLPLCEPLMPFLQIAPELQLQVVGEPARPLPRVIFCAISLPAHAERGTPGWGVVAAVVLHQVVDHPLLHKSSRPKYSTVLFPPTGAPRISCGVDRRTLHYAQSWADVRPQHEGGRATRAPGCKSRRAALAAKRETTCALVSSHGDAECCCCCTVATPFLAATVAWCRARGATPAARGAAPADRGARCGKLRAGRAGLGGGRG